MPDLPAMIDGKNGGSIGPEPNLSGMKAEWKNPAKEKRLPKQKSLLGQAAVSAEPSAVTMFVRSDPKTQVESIHSEFGSGPVDSSGGSGGETAPSVTCGEFDDIQGTDPGD